MADKEIAGGDRFSEVILDALKDSREMCILFTSASQRSEWVTTEYGAAWALNRMITPILHGTTADELPPRLQQHHAISLASITQYADLLKQRLDSAQLG